MSVMGEIDTADQISNIYIQSVNATELVEALQEQEKHSKEGIMISSATIVGFFGFGSFLSIRLRGRSAEQRAKLMTYIYGSIVVIIILHLIIILNVVLGPFNEIFYAAAIIATMAAVGIIASTLIEILKTQIDEERKTRETIHRVNQVAEQKRIEFERKTAV